MTTTYLERIKKLSYLQAIKAGLYNRITLACFHACGFLLFIFGAVLFIPELKYAYPHPILNVLATIGYVATVMLSGRLFFKAIIAHYKQSPPLW